MPHGVHLTAIGSGGPRYEDASTRIIVASLFTRCRRNAVDSSFCARRRTNAKRSASFTSDIAKNGNAATASVAAIATDVEFGRTRCGYCEASRHFDRCICSATRGSDRHTSCRSFANVLANTRCMARHCGAVLGDPSSDASMADLHADSIGVDAIEPAGFGAAH